MIRKDVYHKNFTQVMYGVWWTIASGCTRFMRMNLMVGSRLMTFLSGSTLFTPLAGYYGGVVGGLTLYLLRVCQSSLVAPQQGYKYYLLYHIPSFCAGAYLAGIRSGQLWKCTLGAFVPLFCMLFFITDPVGSTVWWYSLYWAIPICVALTPSASRFMQLLGATFVAHAVGTIRWMLTHHMTAEQWQLLAGIVWYERLLAACVMYGIVVVVDYLYEHRSAWHRKYFRYIRITL